LKRAVSHRSTLGALTVAALGIVFGDIGTSPLYAVKETFSPQHGIPLSQANILGGLSTIFWALMIVVSLKYVGAHHARRQPRRGRHHGADRARLVRGARPGALAAAADADRARGGSLFYGDAVLTPAISVLSAVEGLHIGTTLLDPYCRPLAVACCSPCSPFQVRGTATGGALLRARSRCSGFIAIGVAGIGGIVRAPVVLGCGESAACALVRHRARAPPRSSSSARSCSR
jgi:KUP system potassium uptake protein